MVRVPSPLFYPDYLAPPSISGPRMADGWIAVWIALILALAATAWALQSWAILLLVGCILLALLAHSYWMDIIVRGRQSTQQNAQLLRFLMDHCPTAAVITDGEGHIWGANAQYESLCGYETAPQAFAKCRAPERVELLLQRAAREGRAQELIVADDQDQKQWLFTVQRIAAAPTYFLWSISPAPVAVQVENKAHPHASAIEWEEIWVLPVVCVDKDGYIVAASNTFYALIAPENPVGQLLWHYVIRDSSGQVHLHKRSEGEDVQMAYIGMPFGAQDSQTTPHHLWIFHNETAPAVIAPPTDMVASLLALLPLGLAFVDRDGRFMFMNEAFLAAAGIESDMHLLYPSDLVADEDKTTVADVVQRTVRAQDQKARDVRVRLKSRGEEPVVLTITCTPEFGRAAALLSLKDDREQQKLERQIAQATKMQAIGQLAGGVAHDFNNILTAVIGYCDLMLVRHLPGDADFDDINQIRQNANRAANLVRQLLAFSRQQTLRPQLLNISDVIGELSHLLKRLLGEHVMLHTIHGRNLAPVRADPGQLEQVIVNLAVNARDAMRDGGELTISTYSVSADKVRALGHNIMPTADYVAISVRDTGSGIDAHVMGKIFEPFFTTKEVGRGTGLGLSTVYGIVKQTGGYIFADSVAQKGTCFTIYFPAQKEALPEIRPVAPPTEPQAETWGNGTILVVEDEAMVRAVAERALMRKGYHVMTASNGEEAWALLLARELPVDLLISDVVMPIMDGPTLVRQARARWPDLPIIFMSGYAEEQLRSSINMASVTFLPKPFSVQELGETVRNVLSTR